MKSMEPPVVVPYFFDNFAIKTMKIHDSFIS